MNQKRKNGFTLIELLAVIVILAIIALIAVPVILNIIDKANKSAFKDTAYGVISAGELYFAEQQLELTGMQENVEIELPDSRLQLKGDIPEGKVLITTDGKVSIAVQNGRYCVQKGLDDTDVTVTDDIANCNLPGGSDDVGASGNGERHDDAIAEGAFYGNFNSGVFYSEMPATVSDGDAYLYGNYAYYYYPGINGWYVQLATENSGAAYVPDYPITDKNQASYGDILASINGAPVLSLGHNIQSNHYTSGTFEDCVNITSVGPVGSGASVGVPNSITSIITAFSDNTALTSVIVPNGVTRIELNEFVGCSNLTDIVIPSGLVYIDWTSFSGCEKLTHITFKGTMEQWNTISKRAYHHDYIPATKVICSDGEVVLSY